MIRQCPVCDSHQKTPPASSILPIQWPSWPWAQVHVDLAGPFLGQVFLVLIDEHTKWMEVSILPSATSESTINCLREIFAAYGVPEVLATDNGCNFTSAKFETFLNQNSIYHKTSAPYHPASNGLAERMVQTFKWGLAKLKERTLKMQLSRFLFAYHNTLHGTTGVSPAELMFGCRPQSKL